MCTLIIGRDVLGPRTVVLAANRDEDPSRPTDPPRVLRENPRVVGGRDRLAGGTWLALRESKAAVALLNRHDPERGSPPSGRRSRGLLTLDVATADGVSLSAAALERALRAVGDVAYAPFNLVFASPEICWVVVVDGDGARHQEIPPGWHVLTHRELDDPGEPRAAWLLERLAPIRPLSWVEARDQVAALLREHGEGAHPPVCLHQGRMRTVSSSLIRLGDEGTRYEHVEGRPCERGYEDRSTLLSGPQRG